MSVQYPHESPCGCVGARSDLVLGDTTRRWRVNKLIGGLAYRPAVCVGAGSFRSLAFCSYIGVFHVVSTSDAQSICWGQSIDSGAMPFVAGVVVVVTECAILRRLAFVLDLWVGGTYQYMAVLRLSRHPSFATAVCCPRSPFAFRWRLG